MLPLVDVNLAGAMTLLDLSTLESLEMTIGHTLMMGKVHYYLQAQSLIYVRQYSTKALFSLRKYV